MKKILRRVIYTIISLVAAIFLFGLILAYLPTQSRISNKGISPNEAAILRQQYTGPHHLFITWNGETLFLRRWNPDRQYRKMIDKELSNEMDVPS